MAKLSKKEARKSEKSKIHHQIFAAASNVSVLRKAWIAAIEAGAAAAIAVIKRASDLEIAETAKPEDVPASKSKKSRKLWQPLANHLQTRQRLDTISGCIRAAKRGRPEAAFGSIFEFDDQRALTGVKP